MKQRQRGLGALLLGASCIALAPIFPRYAFDLERELASGGALADAAPLGMIATAFWRMALAAPLFWLLAWRDSARAGASLSLRERLPLLLPGVVFAGDMASWHKAFELTTLANATLLANFATVIVSVIGFVWLGERLGVRFALSVALALAGVAVLLGADLTRGADPITGDLLGLLTACFYAAYLLLIKRLRPAHGVVQIMAHATSACALCLWPIAYFAGEGLWPHTGASWAAVAALAYVSHAGGQGLIAYAMAHLPASLATTGLLLQPVITAALAWSLFGQALSPSQIAGGAVVLVGIALAHRAAQAAAASSSA
jgi:drug/metabolite transporter (DMT)-like permease